MLHNKIDGRFRIGQAMRVMADARLGDKLNGSPQPPVRFRQFARVPIEDPLRSFFVLRS